MLSIGYYLLAFSLVILLLLLSYFHLKYSDSVYPYIIFVSVSGAFVILWSTIPRSSKFIKPGPLISPKDYPSLFKEIEYISKVAQQKAPDEVYLTLEVNAWVTERSSFFGFGTKRVMGVGLPLLQLLTVSQLRSILAHEFGHYYGGDTKLSPIAYKTRMRIERTIKILTQLQSNLVNIFLAYGRMFLKVTASLSRTQELKADTFAAQISGSQNFINALKVVHSAGDILDTFWKNEMAPVLRAECKPVLMKCFKRYINAQPIKEIMDKNLDNEIRYPLVSIYNTHPTLKERITNIEEQNFGSVDELNSAAISLLGNINIAENQLLEFCINKTKYDKLKEIDWKNFDEAYIAIWKADLIKFLPALNGVIIDSLPADYMGLVEFTAKIAKCLDMEIEFEQGKLLSNSIIGEAISVILYNWGWQLKVMPGDKVVLCCNGNEIEPFTILYNLSKCKLDMQEWGGFCKDIGVHGIELGDRSVLKIDENLIRI